MRRSTWWNRRPRITLVGFAIVSVSLAGSLLLTTVDSGRANTALIGDTFTRNLTDGWGAPEQSANPDAVWRSLPIERDLSTAYGFGIMSVPAGRSRAGVIDGSPADVDVRATFGIDRPAQGFGQAVSLLARHDAGGEYRARVRFDGTGAVHIALARFVAGEGETILGAEQLLDGISYAPARRYAALLRVSGAGPVELHAKVWVVDAPEPEAWSMSSTDSAALAGTGVGVRGYAARATTNGPVQVLVDDISVSAAGAEAPVLTAPEPAPEPSPEPAPVDDIGVQDLGGDGPITRATLTTPSSLGLGVAGSYGSVGPGQASYPPPTGAIYVSPNGNNAASGTAASPVRTIARALTLAPSGGTVVLRAGNYHESVRVDRRVTIQNYPGEYARLLGSRVVTNWVRDGAHWRLDNWTAEFPITTGGDVIDPSAPAAGYPDMFFMDSQPMRQVRSRAEIRAGSFYVDRANNRVYIGSDPAGHRLEGSDLPVAITVRPAAAGSVVRGLVVQRYATSVSDHGAVRGYANNLVFENNRIGQNASAGLGIIGDGVRVRANTLFDNGKLGLQVDEANNLVVEHNHIIRNNRERFLLIGSAGGAKFTTSSTVLIKANLVERNFGRGIWLDLGTWDTKIVNNVVHDNESNGIEVEISGNVIVAGNWSYRNTIGVYVLESNDVEIWNNTLPGNTRAVFVLEGTRSNGTLRIPQKVSDVTIRNNILWRGSPDSVSLLGANDYNKRLTPEQMGVSTNYNAFHRATLSAPDFISTWPDWPTAMRRYETLANFRNATGHERSGMEVTNTVDPFFVDAAHDNFHVRAGARVEDAGTPLPTRIAEALGVAAGVPVDIGAIGMP